MAALLSACADPALEPLDRELAALRADPGDLSVPALPELPDYREVSYEHADERSPFMARRPRAEEAPTGSSELAPDLARPREPLEAYVLESLNLVGTLVVGGQRSALVRDPDGKVHRLTTGDYLGTDFGRIVSITAASVQLVEVVATGQGGWLERTRSLTFNDASDRRD